MKQKEYVCNIIYGRILNKMRKAYWKGRRKKYRDMIFYIINLYIHKGSHIKCVWNNSMNVDVNLYLKFVN